ncbi:ImmA/IrrE family metallo-endopeptidase [Rhodococcus pyridinivorans]|uniref:ImmA/IrrE family metallo-endopeptidase n=1 Tax=Rhodococcus pyridinivorans TaxID=103816 RepID=UPI0011100449|nr:ImmA/IrrE family metallo-endopeptidase [Rhodococcus pyridinivorans]MCD2140414.1 ImmA/IrrE family metallo-endopeptidase [Rhodococcus pyridinivorans]
MPHIARNGPAGTAADTLVERLNLVPPVPIEALLGEIADLQSVRWPFRTVDAIMIRRPDNRPQVFYSPVDERGLRQRFTLAHELGHLKLAWHLGNKACTLPGPSAAAPDLPSFQSRPPEEQEADVFASAILVPNRWLGELTATYGDDMDTMLNSVATAQVSATASLLALRRVLPSGWAFQINNQSDPILSRGTELGPSSGLPLRSLLDKEAHGSGRVVLHQQTVRWWRLTEPYGLPDVDSDSRTTTELLRSAIAACGYTGSVALRVERSANGKVGGVTRADAGKPAGELFAVLRYRFRDFAYRDALEHNDFQLWLARKARDKAAKA